MSRVEWRGVRVGQVWGFSLRFYAYIPHVNYNNTISTQRLHLHLIVCNSSYFYLNFIFFNKIVTVLPTGRSLGLARRLSPELVRTGDQGPILDTPLWFHKNKFKKPRKPHFSPKYFFFFCTRVLHCESCNLPPPSSPPSQNNPCFSNRMSRLLRVNNLEMNWLP